MIKYSTTVYLLLILVITQSCGSSSDELEAKHEINPQGELAVYDYVSEVPPQLDSARVFVEKFHDRFFSFENRLSPLANPPEKKYRAMVSDSSVARFERYLEASDFFLNMKDNSISATIRMTEPVHLEHKKNQLRFIFTGEQQFSRRDTVVLKRKLVTQGFVHTSDKINDLRISDFVILSNEDYPDGQP